MSTFRKPKSKENAGFALVAALSIMAVLVLLGVALFSLASVATRSAEIAAAQTEAQANAKAALMMAIGDLQKYTGADTRVTAPADIVTITDPLDIDDGTKTMKVVGAWRSWEGLNHVADPADPAAGRPIAPAYSIKKIDNSSPDRRFLSWLVSGVQFDETNNEFIYPKNAPDDNTVPLLSDGSDSDPDDGSLRQDDPHQIHVVPTEIDGSSRYAWWVSPENQKARVAQPYAPRTTATATEGLVEMGQSHSVPNPEVFGFNSLTPEPFIQNAVGGGPVSRAINRDTLGLIDTSNSGEPSKRFHDLSTSAAGLLTNTATGGWRKDLSLLTEKWDIIYSSYPGGELPLFRFAPSSGATSQVPKPTADNYAPEQSSLYPWSEYSTIIGDEQPNTHHAASASWQSLQSFATAYKGFTYAGGKVTSPFIWDRISARGANLGGQEFYNYHHQQRLYTQIARFQFLVYARAIDDPDEADPNKFELWIKYLPVFTLWNPYNITLELTVSGTLNARQGSGLHTNFRGFGWRRSLPGAMAVTRQSNDGTFGSNNYKLLSNGNMQYLDNPRNHGGNAYDTTIGGNATKFGDGNRAQYWLDARTWGFWLPEGTLTLKPGEAKIISPDFIDPGYGFGGTAMRMKEGFDPSNIVGPEFRIKNNEPRSHTYRFLFRPDRLTQPYKGRPPGAGFSISFGDGDSHFGGTSAVPSGIGDEYHNITALANESQAEDYWPPDEVAEIDYSLGALVGRWTPLFSVSFGPRMTIGTGSGTDQNRPTRGVVQNDALAAMVLSDPGSGDAKDHPVNNTFDFTYQSLQGNSTIAPQSSKSQGYIGTGNMTGNGLSRLMMIEMPLRPMASLIELQSWNPRGNNPYPPFQMNLIGNSDATPLIRKGSVLPSQKLPDESASGNPYTEEEKDKYNLMHDDAYCANHLLFDDWFVSSIAPESQDFGGTDNDIEEVYETFLQGNARLSNRAYRPIKELNASEASSLADEILNTSVDDSWLKVASRFEVEGMFNINSTSVEAWEALLGHAKSREEIALYGASDIKSTTPTGDHPVTRGAAAFDEEAGSGTVIGADDTFTVANEYLGFRSLDDDQIRDLAEKIVAQVRLRGPFLSLAEFINRQLSDDDDLALAGAVQTAINNLDIDPMATLRDPNNSLSANTMLESNDYLDGMEYAYPLAATGTPEKPASSAYGAPGWVRQADILRPIAPVLSARDDTFTIRAYGDKLDQRGNVIAQAWCEAVVKRTRNFCDASDQADSIEPPTSPTNVAFGRKYEIVTFRWLAAEEV